MTRAAAILLLFASFGTYGSALKSPTPCHGRVVVSALCLRPLRPLPLPLQGRPFGVFQSSSSSTSTMLSASMSAASAEREHMPSKAQNMFFSFSKHVLEVIGKIAIYAVVMAFVYQFASPAFASVIASKKATGKKTNFWEKLLYGVSYSGTARKDWKVGDTRSDISLPVNLFRKAVMLGSTGTAAYLVHLYYDVYQRRRVVQEATRLTEYKENMYFDAVDDVLKKLNDPSVKGSTKARLQRELRDLDPKGDIQKFIVNGGNRPDVSYLFARKGNGAGSTKPKPKPQKTRGESDESEGLSSSTSRVSSSSSRSPSGTGAGAGRGNGLGGKPGKINGPVEPYLEVLVELFESLDGVLDKRVRKELVESLKERIESIADPAKRKVATKKISDRIGDNDYWMEYAERI